MSVFLTNAAQTEFDNEVKHVWQSNGRLRETVSLRTNVVGDSYRFTRMGKGMANQKATQAKVTPMNVNHERQIALLTNWNAPEYTDIFDQAEVNFDEKMELAKTIGMALTRREDQMIIDALSGANFQASPTGPDQALDVTTAAAGLTVTELRAAATGLDRKGVPPGDRYVVYSADAKDSLLGTTQVTSIDYNGVRALVSGDIDTFLGFKFILIEDRDEGGLPALTNYAYHKLSVGHAVGLDIKVEINYIAEATSWLCNGILKAGTVLREAAGVVRMTTTS